MWAAQSGGAVLSVLPQEVPENYPGLLFITKIVFDDCFSSLCVCTVEPPPTQAFHNVCTFTYVCDNKLLELELA